MVGGRSMNKLPEPDDVDFVVGDIPPADRASIETERFIEAYKRRPEYRLEAEQAARILDALGIEARDDGMPDAEALLDHWRRCIAELSQPGPGEADRRDAERTTEPQGDPSSKS